MSLRLDAVKARHTRLTLPLLSYSTPPPVAISTVLTHHASRVIEISRSFGLVLKRDGAADVALLLGGKYRSDQ